MTSSHNVQPLTVMTLTSRPLTVMTLTSRHNVQALDSDDSDIQALDSDDSDIQALDSDDPDIQTPVFRPLAWWWLCHPVTMTKPGKKNLLKNCWTNLTNRLLFQSQWPNPLTVMTLTSRHNVQALDSDDSDIQAPRLGSWQWWPWHPDTTFRPLMVMTLSSKVTMSKPWEKKLTLKNCWTNLTNRLLWPITDDQRLGSWQWWPWHPDTTFRPLTVMTLTSRPLTVMTLTSRHHVQAPDGDDYVIQSQWPSLGKKIC